MYDDLDPEEPRRIQILNADGTLFNTILASLSFCRDILTTLPENVYPVGASWRVEPLDLYPIA